MAWQGEARLGAARRGKVWLARQGTAWQGMAGRGVAGAARLGVARRGLSGRGMARCGWRGWHGNNNERKGNDMNEIKHMVRTMSHAECVLYEDHVAALKAARNELPDVEVGHPSLSLRLGIGL